MKIQFRYRTMALVALAISLLAIAGFPQVSSAGAAANANNARSEMAAEKKAAAPGQEKKAEGADADAPSPVANNEDDSAGPTTHGSENGPGGQVCDGDPDNEVGDGGVYENTCDSYPDPNTQGSDNGAGDGAANGKPCEGCVGNADDKDPKGQAGGGPVDNNNGYECDQRGRSDKEGNNGIGFGNPAHTGCEADTDPGCVPTADQNPDCTPKCVPTATQDAACNEVCQPTAANNNCLPCPSGQTMGSNGCQCPAGQVMADGACTTPCVAGQDAACSQETPSCVASSGNERCGGVAAATVQGEQLGRLDVLGVSIEAPEGAVAPAALARTGGFQLTALVQAGIALAIVGLGLTVVGRRRRQTGDIAGRIGD